MTPARRSRLMTARLRRQSDLMHAVQWLRAESLRGNAHADALLREVRRLNHGRTHISQRPRWDMPSARRQS